MAFDDLLVSGNISASGMTAERTRLEVIANNVANALSTRTASGGPFRRQDVLFEAVMQEQMNGASGPPGSGVGGGVRVVGIQDDPSEMPRIHDPGHPDADSDGFVTMPNVSIPIEMVNLMTASRAYEANLKVLQTLRQQLEQALTLLKY
jgi:flagellar basal-body rod protein FlgC